MGQYLPVVALAVLAVLMGLGIVLVQAASPAVAERIGLDNFHFVQHHTHSSGFTLGA